MWTQGAAGRVQLSRRTGPTGDAHGQVGLSRPPAPRSTQNPESGLMRSLRVGKDRGCWGVQSLQRRPGLERVVVHLQTHPDTHVRACTQTHTHTRVHE